MALDYDVVEREPVTSYGIDSGHTSDVLAELSVSPDFLAEVLPPVLVYLPGDEFHREPAEQWILGYIDRAIETAV